MQSQTGDPKKASSGTQSGGPDRGWGRRRESRCLPVSSFHASGSTAP